MHAACTPILCRASRAGLLPHRLAHGRWRGAYTPMHTLLDIAPVVRAAQLMTLLMTAVSGFCTPEAVVSPHQVLWQVTAPTLTVALQPASCHVAADPNTGARCVDWSNCSAAKLAITLTPSKASHGHLPHCISQSGRREAGKLGPSRGRSWVVGL